MHWMKPSSCTARLLTVCPILPKNRAVSDTRCSQLRVQIRGRRESRPPSSSRLTKCLGRPRRKIRCVLCLSLVSVFLTGCIQVFTRIRPLVENAVKGYNATVFAYGSTGSGKTFTMMGDRGQAGIIPRAINQVFSVIESASGARARRWAQATLDSDTRPPPAALALQPQTTRPCSRCT